MVKECKVLSYNPHLHSILVDFDGMKIQFTGDISEGAETIYVKYNGGIATVASKEDYKRSLKPKPNKMAKNIEIESVKDGEKHNSEL
jgi:hypothetical protein